MLKFFVQFITTVNGNAALATISSPWASYGSHNFLEPPKNMPVGGPSAIP